MKVIDVALYLLSFFQVDPPPTLIDFDEIFRSGRFLDADGAPLPREEIGELNTTTLKKVGDYEVNTAA